MSTATKTATPMNTAPPVMGPRARAAAGLAIEGTKRRKLIVLLGAFADGNDGVCRPPTSEMLGRTGIANAKKLFGVLRRLEEDGLLRQLPKNSGFELLFPGADPGAQSQPESE